MKGGRVPVLCTTNINGLVEVVSGLMLDGELLVKWMLAEISYGVPERGSPVDNRSAELAGTVLRSSEGTLMYESGVLKKATTIIVSKKRNKRYTALGSVLAHLRSSNQTVSCPYGSF
jgi:hypothetical protein